jgi:hypothetical protein
MLIFLFPPLEPPNIRPQIDARRIAHDEDLQIQERSELLAFPRIHVAQRRM